MDANLKVKLDKLIEQKDFEKATLILEGVLDSQAGSLDNGDLIACIGTLVMITTLQAIIGTQMIKKYTAMYQVPPATLEVIKNEVAALLKEHMNG